MTQTPTPNVQPPVVKERLYSLDMLRGLDMLLLVAIGPIVRAADSAWHFSPAFMGQFKHGWECFTLWDIIMPLFIFMCGAAIPYALGRRLENGKAGWQFWKHVLVRVAMLWAVGMVVQGKLLSLDWHQMSPYSNTLQSIATGYLACACVMLIPSIKVRIAVPVACALVYTLMLAFGGDYTEFGNFAYKVDHAILSAILPADNPFVAKPSFYTWFTTSLMFVAMTLSGYFATEILRGDGEKRVKAKRLFIYGGALEVVGWVSSIWIPVIKPIFTLSFTAQAMGWCVIALAILYVLTDILMLRKGMWLVILFGQCALAAYLAGGFFRPVPAKLAEMLTQGFPHAFGAKAAMPLMNALVTCAIIAAWLAIWRKIRRR
jgi:predicted acyltransferase